MIPLTLIDEQAAPKPEAEAAARPPSSGPAREDGLWVAWVFDPNRESYRVGEVVSCKILFHNDGKEPITFETESWHQNDTWRPKVNGEPVETRATWFTGITLLEKDCSIPKFVWTRGRRMFWILQEEFLRKIDFGQIGIARESNWRWD